MRNEAILQTTKTLANAVYVIQNQEHLIHICHEAIERLLIKVNPDDLSLLDKQLVSLLSCAVSCSMNIAEMQKFLDEVSLILESPDASS